MAFFAINFLLTTFRFRVRESRQLIVSDVHSQEVSKHESIKFALYYGFTIRMLSTNFNNLIAWKSFRRLRIGIIKKNSSMTDVTKQRKDNE